MKGGRTRHAVQTVSERKATLQWKSTRECGAETPEERETRNGSSAIRHFERGDEDDGLTYTGLPHNSCFHPTPVIILSHF